MFNYLKKLAHTKEILISRVEEFPIEETPFYPWLHDKNILMSREACLNCYIKAEAKITRAIQIALVTAVTILTLAALGASLC